ncbi:hypothetical protein GCM10010365_68030 [Streptomyces poonensis]|uniref:Uncharacterized protein n=1 Tax=Streptomyces poonensis TaxID=68255 RepID=A0A918UVN5_9ACTN|nr:hypothetical protein GCM10010365_68030 [Streptomyces poonensis]GLJ91137.1 hypothetical protein GCM10017589_37430 [Streptomyces poonensis]
MRPESRPESRLGWNIVVRRPFDVMEMDAPEVVRDRGFSPPPPLPDPVPWGLPPPDPRCRPERPRPRTPDGLGTFIADLHDAVLPRPRSGLGSRLPGGAGAEPPWT